MKKGNKDSEVSDAQTMGLPWVEKYRPTSLDDLIAHENIISTSKTAFYYIHVEFYVQFNHTVLFFPPILLTPSYYNLFNILLIYMLS